MGEGDFVPRVTLPTASGRRIDITSFAKKQHKRNLLLVFFRTGKCPICVSQLIDFAQNFDRIGALNAAVLAISLDDAIIQSRTSEKIRNLFPLLLDPDAKTVHAFDVFNPEDKLARPSLFLIGPDRKILYSYVGKTLRDRPALEAVLDVLDHYSGSLPKGKMPKAQ